MSCLAMEVHGPRAERATADARATLTAAPEPASPKLGSPVTMPLSHAELLEKNAAIAVEPSPRISAPHDHQGSSGSRSDFQTSSVSKPRRLMPFNNTG